MDLIDILFSKALLKSSGGGEINNDVATKEFVNAAINAIKNGVSEEYDTLKEIEDTLTTKLTNSPTEWPTWTKEQQAIARGNIGAADLESVSRLKTELVTSKDMATENTRFAIGTTEQTLEVPSMDEFNQIKDDLTDKLPKSPADWPAWTTGEQAAAREKLGVNRFTEIAVITLEEDSAPIISLGCECEALFIIFEIPDGDTCISNQYIIAQNNKSVAFYPSNTIMVSTARFVSSILSRYGDKWSCDSQWGTNNSATHSGSNRSIINNNTTVSVLRLANPMRAGTKISVYGVKS